jgi:hypothetical protein
MITRSEDPEETFIQYRCLGLARIKVKAATPLNEENFTGNRGPVHMNIKDREKNRDPLHPAFEELPFLDLIDNGHRSIGRGNDKGGFKRWFAFWITKKPEAEKKQSTRNDRREERMV